MSALPVVSGHECVKALEQVGFVLVRQKGSHLILIRDDPHAQVVVPNHRQLDRGTLRGILRHAGLSVEEFTSNL